MGPGGLLPVIYGKPLPVCPAIKRQRRLQEEEVTQLEREGTLSREEEESHKKKEYSWDYDNDCPAEIDAEGDTDVGAVSMTPRTPRSIMPATPGGPGDPIYVPSSPPEVDAVMGGTDKRAEGLGASRHAPATEPQRMEEVKEEEVEEDEGMESENEPEEEEIRMFPQKAKLAVNALAVFMKSTVMEGEDKKGPKKRLAKTEEVIWALGRALDQEERGIPRGWEEAEKGLNEEDREYLREVEREWGSRRDKLIDKWDGAMRQLSRKVEEMSKQMAVLLANTGTATKEQTKIAKAQERKVREQNKVAEIQC